MRALGLLVFIAVSAGVIYYARGRSGTELEFDIHKDHFQLDPAVQKYVWDIERRAHHLQMELGPQLDAALRSGDETAWNRIFPADAVVELPAGVREHDHGFVRLYESKQGAPATPQALFAALRAFLAPLASIDRAYVHFDDLSPAARDKMDGAWRGTWTIELQGRDAQGGRHEWKLRHRLHYLHLPGQPGTAEAFLAEARVVSSDRRVAPQPLFEDATAGSGLEVALLRDSLRDRTATFFHGTFLLDYDRDGWADVLVMDDPRVYLYRGLGAGRFVDRTLEAGLVGLERGSFENATIGDFDNDGYDDILFEVGGAGATARAQLWRNTREGAFVPVPQAQIPVADVGAGTLLDYDRDGLVDVYLPNSGPQNANRNAEGRWVGDRAGRPGVLLRNLGGFRFEDVTATANASGGRREIYGAAATDIDLDGDPDLLLVNHMGENLLLENDGKGRFLERPFARTFGGFSMGVATGDLDGDGDPDAYVANMSSRAGHRIHGNLRPVDYPGGLHKLILGFFDGDEVLRNTGDRDQQAGLEVVGQRTNGWAYGPAMIDFDGDGRLDIYLPAGMQSVDPREPDG